MGHTECVCTYLEHEAEVAQVAQVGKVELLVA
jgi:hypothetical protein